MTELATPHSEAIEPDRWVDEYGDYLYRYAWSRLRDGNAAEEVVQETFLAGIRKRSQYTGAGAQRAWLLGILKRKIIDHARERARMDRDSAGGNDAVLEQQLFDGTGHWKQSATTWLNLPANSIESSELWEIVRNCLTHLPDGQASVFTLSVMEEVDSDRICRELEITPSNLWVRLHRARLGLASCVGSRWGHITISELAQ